VILGVPILDTAFSIVRRIVKGRSLAVADKDHLHHRLMRLGHGPRRTVVILWLWTALLSGLALLPTYTSSGNLNALVPIGVLALALILYALFVPGRRNGRNENDGDTESDGDAEAPEDGVGSGAELGSVVDLESRRRGAG
jgi:UDP-GlcNAc:undecaprenyl-phosphate/decaprenyl-phosphate GlcNAc-1-phosphate transferase